MEYNMEIWNVIWKYGNMEYNMEIWNVIWKYGI
jgi:hypothetical protein